MPTTTWSAARADISRDLGMVTSSTTTNITTNQLVVSTGLQSRYPKDDYFVGWYCYFENSGADTANHSFADERFVTDYAASSGTLTVAGPALSAASGATDFTLHRVSPVELHRFYNRARQDLYPQIGTFNDVATVVTGQRQYTYSLPTTVREKPVRVYLGVKDPADTLSENLFSNAGFETWTDATTATSWTFAGSGGSVNREEETTTPPNYAVLHDQYSARMAVAAATTTTLLQTVTPSVATQGMACQVTGWVYCVLPDRVSIKIESTVGTTHGGTGWELLSNGRNLAHDATNVTAGITVSGGSSVAAAVYVDEMLMTIGPSEALDRAWEPLMNWEWLPPAGGAGNGGTLHFGYALPAKRRIRIVGLDLLSDVSADNSTIEVTGDQLGVVYDKTRALAAFSLASEGPIEDRAYWQSEALRYETRVQDLLNRGVGVHPPNPRPKIPTFGF